MFNSYTFLYQNTHITVCAKNLAKAFAMVIWERRCQRNELKLVFVG